MVLEKKMRRVLEKMRRVQKELWIVLSMLGKLLKQS